MRVLRARGGVVTDDRLRLAGVDVDAMRADAQAAVDEATPEGWRAIMLRSPWEQERCPGCWDHLTVDNLAVAALTWRLERTQTLLFSLTVVCDQCVRNQVQLDHLAERTFE